MNKNEQKKFKYTAADVNGKKSSGVMLAENEEELRKALVERGLYPTSFKAIRERHSIAFSKIKSGEVSSFAREFATLINAGIPIADALETLRDQSKPQLKKTLTAVCNDVRSGVMLSDAFAKHPDVFPDLFVNMTHVGEASSSLERILCEIAEHYEKEAKLKRKAASSLVYPCLLLTLTLAVIVLLVAVIIPTFKTTLQKLGTELPPITVFVLDTSDFFVNNYYIIIPAIVIFVLLVAVLYHIEKVRYAFDFLKAKLPLMRGLTSSMLTAQFANGLGTLSEGGVGVIESLEIMSNMIKNKYYNKKYAAALIDIKEGAGIADSFSKYEVFPKTFNRIVAICEKTGTFIGVKKASSYFDTRVETALTRLTMLVEPLIIIIAGAIVAIMLLAVITPMISIIGVLGE